MDFRRQLRESWSDRNPGDALRAPYRASETGAAMRKQAGGGAGRLAPRHQQRRDVYERLTRELEQTGAMDLRSPELIRARLHRFLQRGFEESDRVQFTPAERKSLEETVLAELCGLGPLEPLLADPAVSDILVNGPYEVWVDRYGRLDRTSVQFDDEAHLMRIIDRIVSAHGRHLEESTPYVDARMPDGSRMHAMIPPICSVGPVMAIRRSRALPLRLSDMYAAGTMSEDLGRFLRAAVQTGLNILISGGAATGKTTLLNVLADFIPDEQRVVTIEETKELRFRHPHVIALETRLPNIDNRGGIAMDLLIRNALRMRADRIIVGEVRGKEVFDMLQAMNLGHNGSLTTVHANCAPDALRRLETLLATSDQDLSDRAARDMIGTAFDLVVHLERAADGSRRIVDVAEVEMTRNDLSAHSLFQREEGTSGPRYRACSRRPAFLPRLLRHDPQLEALFAADSVRKPASEQGGVP